MNSSEQAKALFFEALEHHTRDRLIEAEALYRQALALVPDRVSILSNLGAVLARRGRIDEARALADRALEIEPQSAEALSLLAELQRAQRGPAVALAELESILKRNPEQPELQFQRSALLAELGRFAEALAASEHALRLRPEHPPAQAHQALLRAELGQLDAAIDELQGVLRAAPNYLPAGEAWSKLLLSADSGALEAGTQGSGSNRPEARPPEPRPIDRALMVRSLDQPWAPIRQMLPLACRASRGDGRLQAWISRVEEAWPQRLPAYSAADLRLGPAVFENPLLKALLRQPAVPDTGLQKLLCNLRCWLLERACQAQSAEWPQAMLAFHCALAAHCLRNQHAYPLQPSEWEMLLRLRHRFLQALDSAAEIPPAWLPALASYLPLVGLRDVARLQGRSWPPPVQALLAAGLADSGVPLPALRWPRGPNSQRSLALVDYLLERRIELRAATLPAVPDPRVLALACGAGEWALELASRVEGAKVLALDPDPACASACSEQAQRLRLDNLRCEVGDLGMAGAGGYTLIDSGRGLLFSANPQAELSEIKRWLAPRGLLRIRLASKRLREALRSAREHLQAAGLGPQPAELRKARELILALPAEDPARRLSGLLEFHVLGPCRSLLFEYQAAAQGLRDLEQMLQASGLRFRGIEVEPIERAALRPGSGPDTLQAWDEFEARHPQAFTSFYSIWTSLA